MGKLIIFLPITLYLIFCCNFWDNFLCVTIISCNYIVFWKNLHKNFEANWRKNRILFSLSTLYTFVSCFCKKLYIFDISYKIVSLQRSWIQRLYNNNFHEWKLIPQHLIALSVGSKFKFHSNVVVFFLNHLKNFYRSTEIFLLIGRHVFLQVLKPQLAFFCNFYGLTSIFK